MDSGHRVFAQHSLPPWSESPDIGPLAFNGRSRFVNRSTIRTISTTSIGTCLPRYSALGSQRSILDEEVNSTLHDDELYAYDGKTVSRRTADDGNTTTSALGTSIPQNSHTRASVASPLPPRYSFALPRYSAVFGISAQHLMAEGVSRTEHTYSICSGLKNKPWATFRVFSQPLDASERHQKFPHFSGGDMITGLVEFTLDSPQTVNSITVSLRGHIIRSYIGEECDTFLDHQVSIWTCASGDPRFPNPGSTKKFNGKLKGAYRFPFAFPFPSHVDISTATAFSLPLRSPSNPVATSFSLSPLSATVSRLTSSPFPPAITPHTSRFRSYRTPANASFPSSSKNAASAHMSTNQQFPGSRINEVSGGGQRKKFLNQEDRAQAQVDTNCSNSLPVHVYPTPQTFLERGIHANVKYDLGLHIAHGMLRPASKLKTTIVYTPSTAPPLASIARQLAYTEGAWPPGPAADPGGWKTLPKVVVYGELLGQYAVAVECALSLAKPLCYTRGAVIPCYLTLECSNSHALGLLSTPKSPFVRLIRRVRYSQDVSSTIDDVPNEPLTPFSTLTGGSISTTADFPGSSRPDAKEFNLVSGRKSGYMMQEIDEVELAVWWIPPKDAPQETVYMRRLEGEIHLANDLQPTSRFLPFSVEYAVEVLPLVSHVFEPIRSERERRLLVQPVEIATHHSEEGPMPTSFTEPMSDREREKRKKGRDMEKEQDILLRNYNQLFAF